MNKLLNLLMYFFLPQKHKDLMTSGLASYRIVEKVKYKTQATTYEKCMFWSSQYLDLYLALLIFSEQVYQPRKSSDQESFKEYHFI